MRVTLKIASAFLLVGLAFGAAPSAHAACKRFGFTVNDYGKEGPIRDAKALLDKHIASWAAQNGVKKYTVGKKDVSCELFLNFIVFDEHTCTASANVCWGGDHAEGGEGSPPSPLRKAAAISAPAKPAKAAEASKETGNKTAEVSKKPHRPISSEITLDGRDVGRPHEETEAAHVAAEKEPEKPDAAKNDAAKTDTAPAAPIVSAHAGTPTVPSVTETGTLPSEAMPSSESVTAKSKGAEAPVAALTPPSARDESASAAAAAAGAAAAAAERAAAAAETAAAAAKEAAAAAIAAGASERSAIVAPPDVPPLDAAPEKSASRARAMSGQN